MKILSLNSGSSTLKFQVYEMPKEKVLILGRFERIGTDESFYTLNINNQKVKKEKLVNNHAEAIKILIDEIIENNILNSLEELKGIGIRLVAHYKDKEACILNEEILKELETQKESAPLHLECGINTIRDFMKMFPHLKCVGNFDSAFHNTIKEDRYLYGVPYSWYKNYGVRKYGFHGPSCKYITEKMNNILNKEKCNLIICHIGTGASITAIKENKSFDTSMGFTTNSGVIMGTRSGDIDYGIINYMMKKTGKTYEEINNELYYKSGLYGLSDGISNDWRDIDKKIEIGDEQAKLTHYVFVNSIVDYIAKYYMALDNIDAICFTAGVGENSPHFRRMIMDRISKIGVKVDKELNNKTKYGEEGVVSTKDSKIPVYVIPVDEEIIMARQTYEAIK